MLMPLPVVLNSLRYCYVGWGTGVLFAASSAVYPVLVHPAFQFLMGILGCATVLLMVIRIQPGEPKWIIIKLLHYNTMPVVLMHTIFAAGLRALMLKVGIINPMIYVIMGLLISFVGPVIAVQVMRKFKLDVLIYPGKYINF